LTRVAAASRIVAWYAANAWRRPAAAALAALAGLGCFAITAGMRMDLASRTRALHSEIAAASSTESTVTATTDWSGYSTQSQPTVASFTASTAQVHAVLAAHFPLSAAPSSMWTAFETPETPMASWPAAAAPHAVPARMRLIYRDSYALHSRLLAGRRPSAPPPGTAEPTPDTPLEADLTTATAARLGAQIGSVLTLLAPDGSGLVSVRVVGLVTPTDPAAAFWASDAALGAPQLEHLNAGSPYWAVSALIGPAQADALLADHAAALFQLWWGFTVATDRVDADHAAALGDRLTTMSGIESALAYDQPDGVPVTLYSPLAPLLHAFAKEQHTAALELAMPETSIGLIAAITAILLALAATEARRAEARVQRARGAPVHFLVLESLSDGFVVSLPAAGAGALLGFVLPGLTPSSVYGHIVGAALVTACAPALCTLFMHWPRKMNAAMTTRRRTRGTRSRRVVAQCTVAVACAAGLDLARTQGIDEGGAINPYAAAAPVLMAALAALAIVNALPAALRRTHRWAARGSGIVGLLGVARAARRPIGAQIAALVLTTSGCTADLAVQLARAPHAGRFDPLGSATTTALDVLAIAAVVSGCVAALFATRVVEAGRAADAARLSAMGLSARQATEIALVESTPLVLVSALIGAVATVPLLWTVRPALGLAVPADAGALTAAALAVAVPALVLSGLIPAVSSIGRAGVPRGARVLEQGEVR